MRFGALPFFLVAVLCAPGATAELQIPTDVCVYGGTAGGCIAAITAAERGHAVILVEPSDHVGGLMSGGLGRTDHGNRTVIGGKAREYFERNGAHYGKDIEWYLEPSVAEELLRKWLKEAGVGLRTGYRVEDVKRDGTAITSVWFEKGESGVLVTADMFIDATYEGDLMARAGVSHTVGREGRDVYGESLAGKIEYTLKHQFHVRVNPYDEDGGLLPLVGKPDGIDPGQGDKKVQAYNFRLCLTQNRDNMVPYPKPENYDPARYELLRRLLEADPSLTYDKIVSIREVPNGKTDINNNGAVSTDHIGASWDYPEADYEERERIWQDHEDYVMGFFYFLANDPSVPDALQAEVNTWGPAKDEFTDNNHFPHQLYVREARRMIGMYVMKQKDLQDDRLKDDSIGMGSYNSDSHNVQRFPAKGSPVLPEDGLWIALNEGDMQVPVQPYAISYGAIVPKRGECSNLLVVCCPSASHVAFSSIRMEPQYMILGEAAGNAAHLAIEHETRPQDIPIDALQSLLYETDSVLHPHDVEAPYFSLKDLPGIVIDSPMAEQAGSWRGSTSVKNYVGYDYLHELDEEAPGAYVRYRPEIPKAGRYSVRVSYTPNPNRATNVPVIIKAADGDHRITLNQRVRPEDDPFHPIGEFRFDAGKDGYVEIRTEGTDGYVIADAVQWIAVE